jgi:hypothetical protein
MAVICPKCKNKTALVKGTFYFDADEEPYESGESIELNLNGEQWINGHYCEECGVMIEVWDDDACSKEFQREVDEVAERYAQQYIDANKELVEMFGQVVYEYEQGEQSFKTILEIKELINKQ